ncbi:LOW QUALITY PROTEIN: hypothetical protein NC653_000076 [Populus alba x Populus x berolinensis]|uniref:Glycine-rich protein n=1 Tax=Populus alba x Populus x berolinensis TaxID=444605 RepID=A0AAD6RHT6_9ROSI|nr:LOW QUALITY PROTEIN: hypothetical protein NC653_000076 [Populus alba x Populus x berolinensis]
MASKLLLVLLFSALVCSTSARKLVGTEKGSFEDEKNLFHRPGFGGGAGGGGGFGGEVAAVELDLVGAGGCAGGGLGGGAVGVVDLEVLEGEELVAVLAWVWSGAGAGGAPWRWSWRWRRIWRRCEWWTWWSWWWVLAAALVAGLVADFLKRIKMLLFQIIYCCYLCGFGGGSIS